MLKLFSKILTLTTLSFFTAGLTASTTILEDILSGTKDSKTNTTIKAASIKEFPNDQNLTLGYLALCEGTATVSDVIELGTVSKWSHIAMIFCEPSDIKFTAKELSKTNKSKWLCLEANLDQAGNDVHLIPWSTFEEIEKEAAAVVLRPFSYLSDLPDYNQLKIINQYLGVPYEKFITELVGAAFRANTAENHQSLFCSELTALTLQDLGLLTKDACSPDFRFTNNFVPADFSKERPNALHLIGARLGSEMAARPSSAGENRKAFESFTNALRCALQKVCCCSCVQ
ncbi:MAG: hypothetical protein NT128_00480 [Proteobacteria bacterium]|nr:hypothetical protein [Pseudomonadota bacterium]